MITRRAPAHMLIFPMRLEGKVVLAAGGGSEMGPATAGILRFAKARCARLSVAER